LELLKKYNARATFFCIGKNVKRYPELFKRILQEGHSVGNHTYNHENGWETEDLTYYESIAQANEYIQSELFRPPYGRISRKQVKYLKSLQKPYRIIMWSVISADFDTSLSGEQCARNVIKNLRPGQLVVMHDSGKALERLQGSLQRVLEHCKMKGWEMESVGGEWTAGSG
jgi:peptidoglycan-N-acetylglucosamine deacetylase